MGTSLSEAAIRSELVRQFAAMLRVPADQIETDVHLLELGADSIMLVEAQRWLQVRFGSAVEVRRFFEELNTIDRIAAHVGASRPPLSEEVAGVAETALPHTVPASDGSGRDRPWPGARLDLGVMQSQLALVADMIEAQNRIIGARLKAAGRETGQLAVGPTAIDGSSRSGFRVGAG